SLPTARHRAVAVLAGEPDSVHGRGACSRWPGQSAAARKSTRARRRRDAPPRTTPSLRSAVELRLGEIRRRLTQDLVRALEIPILSLELLQTQALVRGQAWTNTGIALGLAHPASQRLGRALPLLRHRTDRSPLRFVFRLV